MQPSYPSHSAVFHTAYSNLYELDDATLLTVGVRLKNLLQGRSMHFPRVPVTLASPNLANHTANLQFSVSQTRKR